MRTKYPVFITVASDDVIRIGLALSVISFWSRHAHVSKVVLICAEPPHKFFEVLTAAGIRMDGDKLAVSYIGRKGSQKHRHVTALANAKLLAADYFVQTDDDILPHPGMDLNVAFDLMRQARDTGDRGFGVEGAKYGMVAADLPTGCHFPHVYDPKQTTMPQAAILTAGAVGGLRFMASAIDETQLPDYEEKMYGYDTHIADGIRAQGMAIGFFSDAAPKILRSVNCAGQFSCVWPHLRFGETFPREGGPEG